MTRSKRFLTGLATSYALIGANIVYTLASVPLALHYLGKEEFGLWALVSQLTGYLILLEFGMSGAIARFLTDHKDDINGGPYGSILKTGSRVFLLQGLLIVLAGIGISIIAPQLLQLPETLHSLFAIVMSLQAALTGAKIATTSYSSPLWSHQRLDISNLSNGLGLIANFLVLWIGFSIGWGMYALAAGTVAGFIISLAIVYFACIKLRLYPDSKSSGEFDPALFRQLFHFGSGLFMMNLGAQLASASQVIIISRVLGIEVAAVWAITTKTYTLAQQFVSKVIDASAGSLAEMLVRLEIETLHRRFRDLVAVTSVLAITSGAAIALMNGPLVELWTSGRVTWNPINNLLLGALLFCTCVTRCHTGFVGVTKQIRSMKYIYPIEGIAFVLISILLIDKVGLTGLLVIALACNLLVTGSYGLARTAGFFHIRKRHVLLWSAKPLLIFVPITAVFLLTETKIFTDLPAITQLAIGIAAMTMIILPSLYFFGIEKNLLEDVWQQLRRMFPRMAPRRHRA